MSQFIIAVLKKTETSNGSLLVSLLLKSHISPTAICWNLNNLMAAIWSTYKFLLPAQIFIADINGYSESPSFNKRNTCPLTPITMNIKHIWLSKARHLKTLS